MLKISDILSVFYPQICKSCSDGLVKGELYLCLHCELNFGEIYLNNKHSSDIEELFWGKVKIESAVAIYQFLKQENLQKIIHDFKYKGNHKLAIKMGEVMGYKYRCLLKDIDAVSFVPMHSNKKRKRGFNQAEKLAEGFSAITDVKIVNILERIEYTDTQTSKGVFERFQNMEDKFKVLSPLQEIKHVLLIDDVITTGATLVSCSKKLVQKGIKVSIVCLAYRGLNF
tara:strand:+ start:85 stop:765 length:681 start_codon:yes stop_codon:yes gene_type:complete